MRYRKQTDRKVIKPKVIVVFFQKYNRTNSKKRNIFKFLFRHRNKKGFKKGFLQAVERKCAL